MRRTGLWMACLLALLLAGCANEQKTATPDPAPTLTPAPTATLSAAAAQENLALTPALELAPDVEAAMAAMDRLASYRTYTRYDFSEKVSASAVASGTISITVEYVRQPQEAQRILMEGTGQGAEDGAAGRMETIRIGDTTWTNLGDDNWIQTSEETGTPFQSAGLIYDTPELLVSVSAARRLGSETINGLETEHYAFDKRQLNIVNVGDMDEARGEFWIAADGGFIVRYRLEAHGRDIELSEGQRGEGAIALAFDVLASNRPLTIVPPPVELGPPGFTAGGFPLPPGTRTTLTSRNFSSFLANQSPADVVAFYKDKLPVTGWSLLPAEGFASGEITSLVYQKGSDKIAISITIDQDSGQTQILVSVEAAP
ncbi:MAG: hypothetical protein WAV74_02030 [Anaerolineae bacterium]